MNKIWPPQDQVFWYLKRGKIPPCRKKLDADVAIVGGGMAGLSAAQACAQRGKKVILLEQYFCGAGASGKSSGFVTPNAELSFTDFSKRYSPEIAKQIWQFISSGVEDIRSNILTHKFSCEYAPQDSFVAANSQKDLRDLKTEHENLAKHGFKTEFYEKSHLQQFLNSDGYVGGVTYDNTFGINSYLYCQEMKKLLEKQGVQIYEETPVTAIHDYTLTTLHADISAEFIILCTDRFTPDLGLLSQEVFHAQTFLMISQVLTDQEIRNIFPTKNYLVWDTDMIYSYFRITADNRLLLGGGNMWSTYANEKHNYQAMIKKLTKYFAKKFPQVNVQFEQLWSGLIGISKDIAPIAGRDRTQQNLYYISATAGLPIAAALGKYSAEHLLEGRNDLQDYFSPYRSFPVGGIVQKILGNTISFGLSNLLKMNIP